MKINIKTNGNKTKNQDTGSYPLEQIKFKIQVQNKTYAILITKIIYLLVTSQE